MRPLRIILAFVCALLATSQYANGELPALAPPQVSRVLRSFDFEERDHGNVEDTPAGWMKVEGPGLPHYLHGEFDFAVSAAGRASFRFDLNGGSITYRYPAGQIPVMANAAYHVSVMCRTTPLQAARARLTAYLCDMDGHVLSRSLRSSDLFASEPGDPNFKPLSVDVEADNPNAASLVLELALLQPALLPDDKLGGQKLLVEDIRGSAWFDDLRVAQVPTVSIRTDSPTNTFAPGETTNLRVRVLDRIATDLSAELRVYDIEGRPVYQRSGAIDFGNDDRTRADERTGAATIPPLAAGWYEARLGLSSHGQLVAERSLRFVRLGDAPMPSIADARFGVIATGLPAEAWSALPAAMDAAAAGRAKVSVWSSDCAIEGNSAAAFDRLLDSLRPGGRSVTACLTAMPPELRKLVGSDRWRDLLRVPADRWQPELAYLLARYATHLDQWQLMSDDAANDFARDASMRDVFARVFAEFSKLTGEPNLAMPWPAWFDQASDSPGTVAMIVPSEVLPEQIPLYLHDSSAGSSRVASVSIRPIDSARYGRAAKVRDLALRVAYSLAGRAARIDLPLPFAVTTTRDGDTLAQPDELLLPQRTLCATLSGTRYAGRVSIAPGVDAFLFDRGGSGVMLVSTPSTAPIEPVGHVAIALGKNANRVELDGTTSPVPHTSGDHKRAGEFDLAIGAAPFFVTDIDASLMLLRASIAIDNPMLESSVVPSGRAIVFRNTYDTPISGTIHIAGPAGWTVSAPSPSFSLNSGETYSAPVNLSFPLNASCGDRILTAELHFQGRDDVRLVVPINVKLGLSDVGLQTLALRSGDEVIIQQVITNYGNRPINYNAFVSVAGLPRQERIISNLPPGKSTIRKYRLPLPQSAVAEKVRSGVREVEGKRMLNDEVEIR